MKNMKKEIKRDRKSFIHLETSKYAIVLFEKDVYIALLEDLDK